MKINVEFSGLGDMVTFADFIMNQSYLKADRQKLQEYERMLQNAQTQLERAYERLREKGEGNPMLDKPISDIVWTVRTYNCLTAENIKTVGQLVKMTPNQLLKIPNFGRKSLKEVEVELANFDLKLAEDK